MTSEPTIRDRAARCRDALIDLLADAMDWCDESG